MTVDEFMNNRTKLLEEKKKLLEEGRSKLAEGKIKVEKVTNYIWLLLNGIFALGGLFGSLLSGAFLKCLGRKRGLLFHNVFTLVGSLLSLVSYFCKRPEVLLLVRFFYGMQGGLACSLVPVYIEEISPASLKSRANLFHHIFIALGILTAQILGLNQLMGSQSQWHFSLVIPIVPAILSTLLLVFLFPETPRALISMQKGVSRLGEARAALQLLRNELNVEFELDEIYKDTLGQSLPVCDDKDVDLILPSYTCGQFCGARELFWPISGVVVLVVAQQFSGVYTSLMYSQELFTYLNVTTDSVQYYTVGTGLVYLLSAIVAFFLVELIGRKLWIVISLALLIIDLAALAILSSLGTNRIFPDDSLYATGSGACVLALMAFFQIGLGSVTYVYICEIIPTRARSKAALFFDIFSWLTFFVWAIAFPIALKTIGFHVFIVFISWLALAFLLVMRMLPETQGKRIDEVLTFFQKQM